MLSVTIKNKIKAAFIHLLVSAVLVIASYLLITQLWYPTPLFQATNVGKIFLIILVVDLVLGPLLTLIVYKKNKKTLVMDLSVIAFLQISALCYGMYSVYEARPVWIAYVVDRFEIVQANEIIDDPTNPMVLPKFGPEYIFVDVSANTSQEQFDMFNAEIQYGIKPTQRPRFYRNFEAAKPIVVRHLLDLKELDNYNSSKQVENILEKHPEVDSFIPLSTNAKDMTVLLDKKDNLKVVAIVNLRPW